MNCRSPHLTLLLVCTLALAGCHPTRPAYLRDTGDLSYYLDQATAIEYPDVQTEVLDEVVSAHPPITNSEAHFDSFWDLTLEDAVAIGLQNSKVIRGYGTPGLQGTRVAPGIDNLSNGPQGAGTLYNVAVRESEPGIIGTPGQLAPAGSLLTNTALDANQGVESALAEFDAQFTSNLGWSRSDQPRNVVGTGLVFTPNVFEQDNVNWTTQLAKKAANGTQMLVRNVSSYTKNNIPASVQPLESVYQTALEMEVRQPLLRGRGTYINRMPVVIARINADQEIANLESQVQNMVTNVEIRYWDLHCAFRLLQTAKDGRDASLQTWRTVNENFKAGKVPLQDESQARGQYYFFRSQVQQAWADLLIAENNLRYLLGVASTDGRLIRPIDEPTKARVTFEWCALMDEALCLRPELRQERWEIKKRELALAYSKNSLLPVLNASGLVRWLGLGDRWLSYDDNVPRFPQDDSAAVNEFLLGDYQEFQFNLDFAMPVGFRRELANVRNAQLKLARELARLEDMELDVSREMTQALQALDANYHLAQTNFNSWAAYSAELDARQQRYEAGTDPITFLLDAQRSRAQGEAAYYQAICEYNKIIALIHRRKGTILSYNNTCFSEGPWPDKAYHDAAENARRRSAGRHVNYGFTRPEVISVGGNCAGCADGCSACAGDVYPEAEFGFDAPVEQYYTPPVDAIQRAPLEEVPAQPQPTPADRQEQILPQPDPSRTNTETSFQIFDSRIVPQSDPQTSAQPNSLAQPQAAPQHVQAAKLPKPSADNRSVDWRRFGLTRPGGQSSETRAMIRQVSYEEPEK